MILSDVTDTDGCRATAARFRADGLPTPNRVWLGGEYLVQIYDAPGGYARLTVSSTKRVGRSWADGIPWDDLQAIKSACGFGSRDAAELYPPTREVVNVANMRHLWLLPEGERLPFGWRKDHLPAHASRTSPGEGST